MDLSLSSRIGRVSERERFFGRAGSMQRSNEEKIVGAVYTARATYVSTVSVVIFLTGGNRLVTIRRESGPLDDLSRSVRRDFVTRS